MRTDRIELESVDIKGFKSIKSLRDFKPRSINVFIGQNGAGKSNFIAFFRFLANMLSGNLAEYTGKLGGASELLFDGPEVTPQLSAGLSIKTTLALNTYKFSLSHASGDTFIFNEETFDILPVDKEDNPIEVNFMAGHKEARLIVAKEVIEAGINALQRLVVYQFHNTTFSSPIRNYKADVQNGWYLEEDGRNLAAVLLELSSNQPAYYQKIISILQQILPFFDRFDLYEEYGKVYLRWREKNSNKLFVATHASDGMLRAMALVTLLCLPPERLPGVMFIDEPELGLHPSAVKVICSLFHSVSEYCQVFIATQSAEMLNEFDADDVVVVTRNERASEFKRLNTEELSKWWDEYSLAELWDRNIIGGRP